MTGEGSVARLVVEALRLDRDTPRAVEDRMERALALGVGGFILFGGTGGQAARLTARARRRAGRPLWMAADLERGAGQQFRGLTELPPPAALAAHPEAGEAARRAGAVTAREALSVGVQWVLAPVVDLDAECENPIVATRSFGADPECVARLAEQWIEGCREEGALACAKHFPGHGRTRGDSHIELPVVDASAETLEADLLPFRRVAGYVDSVMVAHVAFPALGAEGPATLSRPIVTERLREGLGFRGVVATDAMIMAGVGGDDAAASVAAIRAGCDVILYPSDAGRTISALERAVREDEAFADRAREALATGGAVLESAGRPGGAPAERALPQEEAEALAFRTIVAAGPLEGWARRRPTAVIPVSDDPEVGPPAGREGPLGSVARRTLADLGWRVVEEPGAEQAVAILAATPRGWKGHAGPSPSSVERVRAALAGRERGLVVLLGHARWLETLGVPGICAWSTETAMERAAARWLDEHAGGTA